MNSKAKKVEHLVMKFANERRASRGFARLDTDNALVSAAREHSRHMAKNDYLSHYSRERGPVERRVSKYSVLGENISKKYDWNRSPGLIAGEVVESWMGSTGHRRNILKADYVRQGVGVWKTGDYVYTTQIFLHRNDPILNPGNGPRRRTRTRGGGLSIRALVSDIVSHARRII